MQARIGILGGSFDPIHNGHIEIAKAAKDEVGLEKVLFVVAGDPWQKENIVASAEERFEMVRLAIEGIEGFEASDMEIKRGGKTYTIDTLRELKKTLGTDAELFFILGSDVLRELETWKQPEEVKKLVRFISVARPSSGQEHLAEDLPESVISIFGPYLDISATDIRAKLEKEELEKNELESLLPNSVLEFIQKRKLY